VAVEAKQVERTQKPWGKKSPKSASTANLAIPLLYPTPLYLGMDGTGNPLRTEELAGRPGKQADGSAKTGEVKLCTVWSAEALDEEGVPLRDEGSVSYSAALESASTLIPLPNVLPSRSASGGSHAPPLCQVRRRVVLATGRLGIWNIAASNFRRRFRSSTAFTPSST